MNLLKKLLVFAVIITTTASYGQLDNFDLQVTKGNETCPGNGSLSFTVSNTVQGASVLYKIYLLPDSTSPVAVQHENYIGSLESGTYSVVAIQSLGANSATKQKEITIEDEVVPIEFSVTATNQNCSAGGTLTVHVTSGDVVQYEITEGPVRRPLQASNVFTNLPEGLYNVRVFDNCGTGKVITHAIVFSNSVLSLSDAIYPDTSSNECNFITVNHQVTAVEGVITYPLNIEVEYDTMDISGNPLTFNQTFESGPADVLTISNTVPRSEEGYGYAFRVTDNCEQVYEKNGVSIEPAIKVELNMGEATCVEKYLMVNVSKYAPPYSIEFLEAPEGFDSHDFNASATGIFTESLVEYGSEEQAVPWGTYVVKVTDNCGRVAIEEINVELIQPEPLVATYNKGCFSEFGTIKINIPGHQLVSANIISAPPTFAQVLPKEVSLRINSQGEFINRDLPLGTYVIQVTDVCGYVYTVTAVVPEFTDGGFPVYLKPSCEIGFGSMHIKSRNGSLESVVIAQAPASFGQALPYDISENISEGGELFMNSLPEGQYVITAIDECGILKNLTVDILGYQQQGASLEFVPYCGSYTVMVTDESNMGEGRSYWLQKYFPETDTWGHPGTGVAYVEGTEPTNASGIPMRNFVRKSNLSYKGKFRILKKFEGYGNGVASAACYDLLGEYTYTDEFTIDNAYTLACTGQPNDVYLEITGHPVGYLIYEKNGEPFILHNGTSTIFQNLEPAEYTFMIEDACGNIAVKKFNLLELPSIADATTPDDMIVCAGQSAGATTHEFRLKDQDAGILGPLHSAMYTITYHLTQEDADNGVNPLPEYYTSTQNGQTIYARLVHNEIDICYDTTSFRLFVGENPQPEITTNGSLCMGEGLYLTAPAGQAGYLWSNGQTTRSILVTEPGHYSVIVQQGYGNRTCDGYAEIEVTQSAVPEIVRVETQDWTDDQNMITIIATGMDNLLYSIDGENWQEDNVFTGLENGFYTVFVKDKGGCGIESKEAVLLNYPKFFTPNGDGTNDTWRIKYSAKEPNMKINIFDRYGKIVASFGSNHEGWDGLFNGQKLPSTDYWFVVTREDGRELKGHFAMIR